MKRKRLNSGKSTIKKTYIFLAGCGLEGGLKEKEAGKVNAECNA